MSFARLMSTVALTAVGVMLNFAKLAGLEGQARRCTRGHVARRSARSLMPSSIFRPITRLPGSMNSIVNKRAKVHTQLPSPRRIVNARSGWSTSTRILAACSEREVFNHLYVLKLRQDLIGAAC